MCSWMAEVTTGDGHWNSNALRFRTREAAERYAADLYQRWTMCTDYRAVVSDDAPSSDRTVDAWETIVANNPRSVKL